jgi:hypothetical protein
VIAVGRRAIAGVPAEEALLPVLSGLGARLGQ